MRSAGASSSSPSQRDAYIWICSLALIQRFFSWCRDGSSRVERPLPRSSPTRGQISEGQVKSRKEAFAAMESELQQRLAKKQIKFCFKPPASVHFGGAWEGEIQSDEKSLQVVIGAQVLLEEVLLTPLI